MIKIDQEDAYFGKPLHRSSGIYVDRNFASKGDIEIFSITKFKDFVINFKKSQLRSVKKIKLLELVKKSVNMAIAFPQEKVLDIQTKCKQLIASPKITTVELTKRLGEISFTAQTLLPGRIQRSYL